MTVTSETNRTRTVGDGIQTNFAYGFKILLSSHLHVYVSDADDLVVTELTETTHYTVNDVGEASGSIDTVDLTAITGEVELPANWHIACVRIPPFTQLVDIENQGGYYPDTLEEMVDLAIYNIQSLKEEVDRCFKTPITSNLTGNDLRDFILAAVAAAQTAQAAAEAAQALAETAQTGAETAETNAATAQAAAEAAQTAAETAQTAAEAAQTAAETAQTGAETAETNAATAQAAAEAAQTAAETAETNAAASEAAASTSETNAAASAVAADSSATDAEAAQTAAETAQAAAEAAQTAAETAQAAAEAAQAAAEAAGKAAKIIYDHTDFSVANNQAAFADVTGLAVVSGTDRTVEVEYMLERSTDSAYKIERANFALIFNADTNTWLILPGRSYGPDDAMDLGEFPFQVVTSGAGPYTGQVQYKSSSMAGAGYVGAMKFIQRVFE